MKEVKHNLLNITPLFDFKKFIDFKTSLKIGGPVENDKITYTCLSYQIQSGIFSGFSNQDICASVVEAIFSQ